jgi:tripartite-type tricarboxylate transporter receptor subunit TctC
VVENKSGAGGSVAALDVKRAAPDGYTLMYTISNAMTTNKVLYKNLQYDPDKDFDLISYIPVAGLPLVVSSNTGCKTFAEFVTFAKTEKVNVGTIGAGTFAHMCISEVNMFYGLNIEAVHYRGEGPTLTDVASGSIHGAIAGATTAQNVIDAGWSW